MGTPLLWCKLAITVIMSMQRPHCCKASWLASDPTLLCVWRWPCCTGRRSADSPVPACTSRSMWRHDPPKRHLGNMHQNQRLMHAFQIVGQMVDKLTSGSVRLKTRCQTYNTLRTRAWRHPTAARRRCCKAVRLFCAVIMCCDHGSSPTAALLDPAGLSC
jgi:hypothetical protein